MPGTVQSIERAAAVLRLLAGESGPLSLGQIARSLDLAKGTTHGILATLRHVGFVEQDRLSGQYRLGSALLQLGHGHLDVNELRSHAINWADPLAARSGEAVRVGTVHDGQVLVVHHVFRPDDTFQTLDVGSTLPLHATALGKVLLAYRFTKINLDRFTRRTIRTTEALEAELQRVREAGWSLEAEELTPGTAAVAAPIRGSGGLVVGAVGISGLVERICDSHYRPHQHLVALVREAARAISRDLGAARR
ncbi:IclR family transcriptional regulator [Paractinoplanes atraurantiacus]|uniref:IclR family transcriptional regulator n=1 Tax=Paractinoplanes atraurantiacus TaxID=1036182 RepID=UPI000BE4141F|nr:IclR family transcriptional regulator [Actinoplanes atraurantiacus]